MPKFPNTEIRESANRLAHLSSSELHEELSRLQRVFSDRSFFTEVEDAKFSFIQFLLNQRANSEEPKANKLR